MTIRCLAVLGLLLAPAAQAEALHKCTDDKGAVSIQSAPCPRGSTQVWRRETVPEPGPAPEALAARAELARAEAERAAEQARLAELARQAAEARRAEEARRASEPPVIKSDCRLAHEFNDRALSLPFLDLNEGQRARLRDWVIETCRDPDAPVAEAP